MNGHGEAPLFPILHSLRLFHCAPKTRIIAGRRQIKKQNAIRQHRGIGQWIPISKTKGEIGGRVNLHVRNSVGLKIAAVLVGHL